VFADVVCPFTHVGLTRLVAQRARRRRHDVGLWVRAWPLELVNGTPLTGVTAAAEVEALRATVAPDLFTGFDPGHFPSSSGPALALAAYAHGLDPALGERVSLGLRHALFEEGRDVADPAVLRWVAGRHGFELPDLGAWADAVVADWTEGVSRGVVGSPHFFFRGADQTEQGWFCPTLHITHVDGRLSIEVDHAALTAFLEACFD
jgi:predicted DsbA family dithiol-disulfide isomerase